MKEAPRSIPESEGTHGGECARRAGASRRCGAQGPYPDLRPPKSRYSNQSAKLKSIIYVQQVRDEQAECEELFRYRMRVGQHGGLNKLLIR